MKKIWLIPMVFLLLVSFASAEQIAFDDFETGTLNGGTGWEGVWSSTGDCLVSTLGNPIGTYNIRADQCTLSRNVDTSSYTNTQISFYAGASSLENGDICSYEYFDGTSYQNLLTLNNGDDDGVMRFYSYNVTNIQGVRLQAPTNADYCYLDNIEVSGDTIIPETKIFSQLQYQQGTVANFDFTSTATSQLHTIGVYESDNTLICQENIVSPSVANTVFSSQCLLPTTTQNNAYVTIDTAGANTTTKTFNIVNLQNNPSVLNIDRVFFSPQVLQGGSTEIFALLEHNITIDEVSLIITFPNNLTREFSMSETSNVDEYRVLISDTFLTGNVTFDIYTQGATYFDTYTNKYEVVPYSVDTVNKVLDIYEATIEVYGTEYVAGDFAKTWLQLFDQDNIPINDAICEVSIYYPNGLPLFDEAPMTNLGVDGIYYYDFIAPNTQGVYPAVAECFFEAQQDFINASNLVTNIGSITSGGVANTYFNDEDVAVLRETASDKRIEGDITFDNMCGLDVPENLLTGLTFIFNGDFDTVTNDNLNFWLYNFTGDTWIPLNNKLITPADDVTVTNLFETNNFTTSGIVNSTGSLIIRFNDSDVVDNARSTLSIDYLQLSCDQFASPEAQILKGSSEAHISRGDRDGDRGFYVEELERGELRNDSYLDGIDLYYTVSSQVANTRANVNIELTTFRPFDCEHITAVQLRNSSNEFENVSYTTRYLDTSANICTVVTQLTLQPFQNYEYKIINENYWKINLIDDLISTEFNKELTDIACINYQQANGLPNFTLPPPNNIINNGYDEFYQMCYGIEQAFDEYVEDFNDIFTPIIDVNINLTPEQMFQFEEEYDHIIDEGFELYKVSQSLFAGLNLGNSYSLAILQDPYPPANPLYSTYFANISTSYLNYAQGVGISSQVGSISSNITNQGITYIGGTQYNPNEEGLLAVRLVRSNGQADTGGTCSANILYPNLTNFVTNVSLSEYGEGIYTYNFTVPSTTGIYIYYVDCDVSGRSYKALNTFEVDESIANQINLSTILSYLDDINTTVTTIDGRTVTIQDIVNDSNNRLILLNNTIIDLYNLALTINQTTTQIYDIVDSVNGTVIDIQTTLNGVENVVFDINSTVYRIEDNTVTINNTANNILQQVNQNQALLINITNLINGINTSNQDVLDYLSLLNITISDTNTKVTNIENITGLTYSAVLSINTSNQDVLDFLDPLNNSVQGIFDYLVLLNNTIDGSFQDVLNEISLINTSNQDVLDFLAQYDLNNTDVLNAINNINTSNQDVLNFLAQYDLNNTDVLNAIANINTSNQDVLDAISLINTSNQDVLNYLSSFDLNNTDVLNAISLINTSNQDVINYLSSFDLNNTDVLNAISLINTSNQDVINYLSSFDLNNTDVLNAISLINTSNQDVLNYLSSFDLNNTDVLFAISQINTSNQDVINYLSTFDLNNTDVLTAIANINTSNQDVLDAIALINTSNQDVLDAIDGLDFNNSDVLTFLDSLNITLQTNFSDLQNQISLINTSNQDVLDAISLLNTSNQDVLDFLAGFDLNNTDVLTAISNINTSNQDVLNYLSGFDLNNTDVLTAISLINTSNVDVLNYLSGFDLNNTDVLTAIGNINTSNQDVLNYLSVFDLNNTDVLTAISLINTSNVDVLNYLSGFDLNNTDVLTAISLINTSNTDVLNYLSGFDLNNTDVLTAISLINNTDVLNYLSGFDLNNTDVLTAISNINTSNQDVLNYLSLLNVSIDTDFLTVINEIQSINTSNQDVLNFLSTFDLNNTDVLTAIGNINTSNQDVLDALSLINTSNADVLLELSNINNNILTLNVTSNNIYEELLNQSLDIDQILLDIGILNTTTNNIESIVLDINTSNNNIYTRVLSIEDVTNNSYLTLIDINTTSNLIYATSLNISSLSNDILGVVEFVNVSVSEIQVTVNNINDTVNNINSNIISINSTLVDIGDNILTLNASLTSLESIVSQINTTTTNDYLLSIVINDTLNDLSLEFDDFATELSEVHTLNIEMNDTLFSIENLLLNVSSDLDGLTNITLSINSTLFIDVLNNLTLIQDLIANQTEVFTIAFADVSFFDDLNASDYYDNATIDRTSILETTLMDYEITTLQNPVEGDSFRLHYYFFSREDSVLVAQETVEVLGVDTHDVRFTSDDLLVRYGAVEDFDVLLRVEMLNGFGFYQSFPFENIGRLRVNALTDNGGRPQTIFISTETVFPIYESGEDVVSEISILNTNGVVNDGLLTYYLLSPSGEEIGRVSEPIDLPSGTTRLVRTISLPVELEDGDYDFVVEVSSDVDPTRREFQTFSLLSGYAIFDRLGDRLPIWYSRNLALSWLGLIGFVLLLLFVRVQVSSSPSRGRYKKVADVDRHDRVYYSDKPPIKKQK